jgi:hypothetical protein
MKRKYFSLNIDSNTDLTLLLFDYSIISNINFKEILLKTTAIVTDIDKNYFVNLLDNEYILKFIHQFAQLMNKMNYSKLQLEQ